MKKEYKLIKTVQDLPFREWLNDKIEVYVFENNGTLKVINGICPHYYGELELDKKNNKLKCSFHHLKVCPKTLISNNKKFKKIQEFKIISRSPIVIEV
jgi:Ferredoxin subunits of nitrite reductase and ring-hydroxylating dioxygenases